MQVSEGDAATPPDDAFMGKNKPKNKLYFDDGTRQPLGHSDGLWVLMQLSACFRSVGKIRCHEA